jgi:hypothetical protein
MKRFVFAVLMFAGACAHEVKPTLSTTLMNKCTAACSPADAVAASVVVTPEANDLWQCLCRPAAPAAAAAIAPEGT